MVAIPKKTTAKQAKATTTVQEKHGAEETQEENVGDIKTFDTPPVMVEFGMGATLNQGDYNSIKFHVGITVPSAVDDIEETYTFAKEFVEAKLQTMIDENTPEG